jgi:WD40 repeat protein
VAKLTESRIVAIWLHPSPHKVIAAAGDKEGNLGIWDVDHKGGPTEGIYKYQPHVGNICRLHSWYQNPSKLYSASYDGTIRFLDLEKEVLSLAFTAPEGLYEMAIVDAAFNDDGSTVYAGRNDGKVSLMDFRSKQSVNGYEWTFQAFENSRINSVQQHTTDPNLVVAAAGGQGGSVAIYDVRKASSSRDTKSLKPLHQLALHSKSINAAYISPNGQFIVSVSQDNTVRAWTDFATPGAKPQSGLLRHDNHTGRWLSTFRPAFDPKSETAFVLGSMDRPRKMEVFNPTRSGSGPASINLLANLKGDFLGSVCSRNCFHASMNIIAGGNSSGRVHILR